MLTYANFPRFYSTISILIRLSLQLWEPIQGLGDNDSFVKCNLLLYMYNTALELFAENAKKFPKSYLRLTLKHAGTFIQILERKIGFTVKWRNTQSISSLGSIALLQEFLQNCTNVVQATRNFVTLLLRIGKGIDRDDGVETEIFTNISTTQSLDRVCLNLVAFIKSICKQQNLTPPNMGEIGISIQYEGFSSESCDDDENDRLILPFIESEKKVIIDHEDLDTVNNTIMKNDEDGFGIEGGGWG